MAKSKTKDKKAVAKGKKAKPVVKAKAKPVAKAKSKPVAKKVAKPVKKKVAPKAKKPVAKAKTVSKKTVKKVVQKAKPVAKKKAVAKKPVAKKKVVVKAKAKPVKKVLKKIATKKKPVAKKAVKPAKPVKKVEVKKAAKPVAVKKEKKEVVVKVPGKKGRPAKPVEKKIVREAVKPEPRAIYKPNLIVKPQPVKVSKPKKGDNLDHRYSDDELKMFKDLVDKKLVSAREELKYLKEALDNHNDSQAGSKAWNMEEGTDTSEMETLMNQISRQHQYIRNLELALVRIENKTYGICRVTGKLIPKERLRVVPHATLSLEAKLHRKTDDEVNPAAAAAAPPADFSEGFED